MISVCFQGKPLNITEIQVYGPATTAKEAEWFYEDLQDLLELTPKKGVQISWVLIPLLPLTRCLTLIKPQFHHL